MRRPPSPFVAATLSIVGLLILAEGVLHLTPWTFLFFAGVGVPMVATGAALALWAGSVEPDDR